MKLVTPFQHSLLQSKTSMTTPEDKLNQIAQEIVDRDVCPELRVQASQLVMGSGNPEADIVLIGEAPGAKEDLQGVPFVGASGKRLDEMLAAAQLDRDDVYITNIVKYRPPNNRDPLEEEKTAFLPYLERQLDVINPRVIMTLGQHSLSQFVAGVKVSEVHGQPQELTIAGKQRILMPLYHPAYGIYNQNNRQLLIDDFMKVKDILADTKKESA